MPAKTPKYAFVLAVVLGIAALAIPNNDYDILILIVGFVLAGTIFGYLWPVESWRWGLWLAGPIMGALALSLLFAGNLEAFVRYDLLYLTIPFASSALAAFMVSRYRSKAETV